MTTKLLPVEVEISDISDATSSIITPDVIDAYSKCGGDFIEAVPYWSVYFQPFQSRNLTAVS